jgi:hypothetical protein
VCCVPDVVYRTSVPPPLMLTVDDYLLDLIMIIIIIIIFLLIISLALCSNGNLACPGLLAARVHAGWAEMMAASHSPRPK